VRLIYFVISVTVGDLQSQLHHSKESKVSFACPLINTGRIDVTRAISYWYYYCYYYYYYYYYYVQIRPRPLPLTFFGVYYSLDIVTFGANVLWWGSLNSQRVNNKNKW